MAGGRARRGVFDVLFAATLTGTAGTAGSFAPDLASAPAVGATRLFFGGIGLLLALPLAGGDRTRAIRLLRTSGGVTAALMAALYQLTFFAGVDRAGVAVGTLVAIGSSPIFVGLVAWAMFGERPTTGWWFSTAICIAGITLLSGDGALRADGDVAGVVLAVTAGGASAGLTVAAKRLIVAGAAPSEALGAGVGGGAVLVAPVLLATGAGWIASMRGIEVAMWLGLVSTASAYVLFGRGLRALPAGPVATLLLAESLVAAALGVIVLGETVHAVSVVGATLLLTGLVVQARSSSSTPIV